MVFIELLKKTGLGLAIAAALKSAPARPMHNIGTAGVGAAAGSVPGPRSASGSARLRWGPRSVPLPRPPTAMPLYGYYAPPPAYYAPPSGLSLRSCWYPQYQRYYAC